MDGKSLWAWQLLEGSEIYLVQGNCRKGIVNTSRGLHVREDTRQIPPDQGKLIRDHLEFLPPQMLRLEAKVWSHLLDSLEKAGNEGVSYPHYLGVQSSPRG